jgi:hypothetical protein
MDRSGRLQSARTWLKTYTGKNIVAGYRRHFGVDWVCAFIELEMLGVKIGSAYKEKILKSVEGDLAARRRRKARQTETHESSFDQDETFAYIAGYTEGGFAFGVTWEEWERLNQEALLDPEGVPNDIEPTAQSSGLGGQVETAERVMRQDRDALRKLAE